MRAGDPDPGCPSASFSIRTRLAALAGPHRPARASAAAPPPAAGPGAAFPAPEQWPRGPVPGNRRPSAAGRSHQRSTRQPRQPGTERSRDPRTRPLPGRAPGAHATLRRAPHEPRVTREASMTLRLRRGDTGGENSAAWSTGKPPLHGVPVMPEKLSCLHGRFQIPARSAYTGGQEPPRTDAFATLLRHRRRWASQRPRRQREASAVRGCGLLGSSQWAVLATLSPRSGAEVRGVGRQERAGRLDRGRCGRRAQEPSCAWA